MAGKQRSRANSGAMSPRGTSPKAPPSSPARKARKVSPSRAQSPQHSAKSPTSPRRAAPTSPKLSKRSTSKSPKRSAVSPKSRGASPKHVKTPKSAPVSPAFRLAGSRDTYEPVSPKFALAGSPPRSPKSPKQAMKSKPAAMKMKGMKSDDPRADTSILSPKPPRVATQGRKVEKWNDATRALLKEAVEKANDGFRCINRQRWPGVREYFNAHREAKGVALVAGETDWNTFSAQILRIYQHEKIIQAQERAAEAGVDRSSIKNNVGRRVNDAKVKSVMKEGKAKGQRASASSKDSGRSAPSGGHEYDEKLAAEVVRRRALQRVQMNSPGFNNFRPRALSIDADGYVHMSDSYSY